MSRISEVRRSSPQTVKLFFDFISPYAYVAVLEAQNLQRNRTDVEVTFDYIPTLFAGLLNAHGQLGPAEIKPKHKFVFKDAIRKAKKDHNLDLKFPPAHPFMPLPSLRLATALRQDQHPLYSTVVENIYHGCWRDGQDITKIDVLAEILRSSGMSGMEADSACDRSQQSAIKQQLRTNTQQAVDEGVFGVPSYAVPNAKQPDEEDEVFFGSDQWPFVEDMLNGTDPITPAHHELWKGLPRGAERRR